MTDYFVCINCAYTTTEYVHAIGHDIDRGHNVILESEDIA